MGRNSGSISIPSSRVIRGWKCNFFRGFEEGNLLLAIIKCFQHWIFRFKKRDVYKFAKERSNIPETLRSIFYEREHLRTYISEKEGMSMQEVEMKTKN